MILSPVTPIGYFISKCDFYHENVFEKLLIITLLSKKKNKTQYFKKIDVQNHINLIARMRSCCSMFIWKLFWDNHSDLVPFFNVVFIFIFSNFKGVLDLDHKSHGERQGLSLRCSFFFFYLICLQFYPPYYLLGAFISTIRQVQWQHSVTTITRQQAYVCVIILRAPNLSFSASSLPV